MLKKYFIICLFMGASVSLYAQTSNALYFFWGAPQSTMLNPAINPKANFYAGFAGGFQVSNSALDLNTVLKYEPSLDSSVFAIRTSEGTDEFLNVFANSNFFEVHPLGLINLGFRAGDLYFGFDLNTKAYSYLTYPSDLPEFLLQGNLDNPEYDFSNSGINIMAYQEVATRIAYNLSSDITIGWRGKLLFGLANLSTTQTTITFTGDYNQWDIPIQSTVNLASPALEEIENFSDYESLENVDFQIKNPGDIRPSDALANFGLGMDLGINYQFTDRLEFAASVVDLGYINWTKGVYNMKQDGNITIEPLDIESLNDGYVQALVDTIRSELTLENNQNSYITWLPTKLYLSTRYLVHPKIGFGLVSKTTYFDQKLQQSFTASANLYPLKGFSLSLVYSYMNRSFQNAGLAMMITPLSPVIRILPMDFFFMIDNIPVVFAEEVNWNVPIPHKMKALTFMAGINFRLGINRKKQQAKDEPLFYY